MSGRFLEWEEEERGGRGYQGHFWVELNKKTGPFRAICSGERHFMVSQAQAEIYDLLILGSGAGSKLLAWTFAGQGQRVAVVERKYVGGACPNIACLPSKNIIHTAQIAQYIRRSEE